MTKLLLLCAVTALTLSMCCAPPVEKQRDSVDKHPEQLITVKQDFAYQTRINFIVYTSEMIEYPETEKAFEAATQEWSKYLPIQCVIHYCDDVDPFEVGFVKPSFDSTIVVRITKLTGPEFGLPKQILGMWEGADNRLLLNGPFLEVRASMAKATSLHEIGHVLGIPHIVNDGEGAASGYIILPKAIDAKKLIMYPTMSGVTNSELTEFEINIAKEHLILLNSSVHFAQNCIQSCGQ